MAQAIPGKFALLEPLEEALGHKFAHPDLLMHALTHRSQSFEAGLEAPVKPGDAIPNPTRSDNERLEFLGDAILGLVVADHLFRTHPDWQEGELTRLRAQLVSRKHMGEVAQSIGLGDYLLLGKGEERSGGRKKLAILANAMEAVIAALYLDAPDHSTSRTGQPSVTVDPLAPVRKFAERHILGSTASDLAEELRSGAALGDHKSALQEHLQASRSGVPTYRVESESGPDHRKRFQVSLRIKSLEGQLSETIATGNGSTKKKAEQEAARRALANLARQAASADALREDPVGDRVQV